MELQRIKIYFSINIFIICLHLLSLYAHYIISINNDLSRIKRSSWKPIMKSAQDKLTHTLDITNHIQPFLKLTPKARIDEFTMSLINKYKPNDQSYYIPRYYLQYYDMPVPFITSTTFYESHHPLLELSSSATAAPSSYMHYLKAVYPSINNEYDNSESYKKNEIISRTKLNADDMIYNHNHNHNHNYNYEPLSRISEKSYTGKAQYSSSSLSSSSSSSTNNGLKISIDTGRNIKVTDLMNLFNTSDSSKNSLEISTTATTLPTTTESTTKLLPMITKKSIQADDTSINEDNDTGDPFIRIGNTKITIKKLSKGFSLTFSRLN